MDREWRKRIPAAGAIFTALAAFLLTSPAFSADGTPPFVPEDTVLLVAARPEKGIDALSERIQEAKTAGASVRVVYLTHGEAEDRALLSYKKRPALSRKAAIKKALTAKAAAVEAMKGLGLEASRLTFLGYPDSGLMDLWLKRWGAAKPYRSLLTRINRVPFKESPAYGHAYKGEELLKDLERVLLENAPTRILFSGPSESADAQAAWLFSRAAVLGARQKAPLDPVLDGPAPEALRKEVILKDAPSIVATFPKDRTVHRLIGEELWTSVPLPAAFDEMGVLSVYVFPYKRGVPFDAMPKFSFRLFGKKLFVYDRAMSFHDRRVAYSLEEGRLLLRLPMALLRHADHLFVSARAAKGAVSPDFGSWKMLEVV